MLNGLLGVLRRAVVVQPRRPPSAFLRRGRDAVVIACLGLVFAVPTASARHPYLLTMG